MECWPVVRPAELNVATPPVSVSEPSGAPLSRKVTVPVAEPGATVARKVTFCPKDEGFSEELSATDVRYASTVWV